MLVHGIAQEQRGADVLEASWLPALAAGVRAADDPELADRLWRAARPGGVEARMAYYGDLFLAADAQGAAIGTDGLDADLAEELALTWLQAGADRADDPRDRRTAQQELQQLTRARADRQGGRAAARPVINALTRLRWFAPLGVGLAGKFVYRALNQVSRYLAEPELHQAAQQRVLSLIGPDTRLIIAHSLGTVVAFEALHQSEYPVALITLGSPLGLRAVIYDRLQPQPPSVPACLLTWDNYADRDDLVAAQLDIAPLFPAHPDRPVDVHSHLGLNNGSAPHESTHYLTKPAVGRAVINALTNGEQ